MDIMYHPLRKPKKHKPKNIQIMGSLGGLVPIYEVADAMMKVGQLQEWWEGKLPYEYQVLVVAKCRADNAIASHQNEAT